MFLWRNLKSADIVAAAQAMRAQQADKLDTAKPASHGVSAPAKMPEPIVGASAVQS